MRSVHPFLFAGFIAMQGLTAAEPRPAEELLALEGQAFLKAVDDAGYPDTEHYSTSDLIKIAEKLAREQKKFPDKNNEKQLFNRFFDEACEKPTSEELDQLVGIYVTLEPSSFEKRFTFENLAAAWIARELAGIEPSKVAIPQSEITTKPEIRDASADLIAGWKFYKNVALKADEFFGHSDDRRTISFQENEATFYRLLDDVLLKRGDRRVERLTEFTWGGTCGTGSELLGEPQSVALFMALLHERRLDEAVAASIHLRALHPLVAGGKSVRIAFLKKCGVDWEAMFAGSLLGAEFVGRNNQNVEELALEGSERALAFLIELAMSSRTEAYREYARALTAFLPQDPDKNVWSSDELMRKEPFPLSAEEKKKIIQVLEKFVTPKMNRDLAEVVVTALSQTKSPDAKPALRVLLKHPSERVARSAADALTALGETVTASVLPPVQFKILANGKPLPPETSVSWGLGAEYTSVGDVARVQEAGLIKIAREYFQRELKPVTLELHSLSNSPAEALYFKTRVPVPTDLDAATVIDIEARPVELAIEPHFKPTSEKLEAMVRIRRLPEYPGDPQGGDLLLWPEKEFTTLLAAVTRFALQKGTYSLEVLAPGAERFATTFRVVSGDVTVRATLKPGADLRVQLVRPDGEREVPCHLLKEGRKLDDENAESDQGGQTFRGLALGNYILRVPSSSEQTTEREDFAPAKPYAGKAIPFTIVGDVPMVDLGEIHLDPAN
jgi:hypothetical protein